MKKTIAVFLTVLIISQTLINVGLGVYYHFNKVYITQQLCENKNNPKLHCNGHCYLSKQLKKAEEGESKSAQVIKEKEEIISNQVSCLPADYFPSFTIIKIRVYTPALYFADNTGSLLKPPSA